MADHTHADPNLHPTTCPRCAREWELRRATDPLHVEAPEPPQPPRWRWSLRRRKR
jgi:hypothetical protein